MEVQLEQIWSSDFYPWQSNEPWNTIYHLDELSLNQKTPVVSYGANIPVQKQTLILNQKAIALSYGYDINVAKQTLKLIQKPSTTSYGVNVTVIKQILKLVQKSSTLKYGIAITPSTQILELNPKIPTLKYGYNIQVGTHIIKFISLFPPNMLTIWDRIESVSPASWSNTSGLTCASAQWETVGTILWSKHNYPWLVTYYPWQESGGEKPTTTWKNINKP